MYIPLRYTYEAKYSKAYVVDQVLLVNVLLAVAATSSDLKSLVSHLACVPVFVIAFMCVYEIGYFENDMRAARLEAAPVLGANVARFADYRIEPFAWISALALSGLGALIAVALNLRSPRDMLIESAIWVGLLAAVRAAFFLYNRLEVGRRPPLYVLLQLLKYNSVFVLFRPTLFGAVIAASQVAMMATVYWVYRLGGRQRTINEETMRLLFACAIAAPLLLAQAGTGLDTPAAAALAITWLVLRLAKPPVMAALRRRNGPQGSMI